MQYFAFNKEN